VGQISVVGAVGRDGFGWELRQALAARGIDGSRLVEAPEVQTFTYTKVINGATGEEDLAAAGLHQELAAGAEVERALIAQLDGSGTRSSSPTRPRRRRGAW
jgi:sugar/nucleoside kinase (ribokinase family)